ncbi:MAG: hypothetical protein ACI4C1_08570 [Lachnospiraceae bacterium]
MKKKIVATAAVMVALLSLGSVTTFAAENYSYLTGQERSGNRIEVYAQAESFATEEEAQVYLDSQGIGENEWSEEAAASYSFVKGQQRGMSFRTDDTDDNANSDMSSYSYVTGRQRGSSYQQ